LHHCSEDLRYLVYFQKVYEYFIQINYLPFKIIHTYIIMNKIDIQNVLMP